MRTKQDVLKECIDTLECYYFLVQALDDQGHEHIGMLRRLLGQIPKSEYSRLTTEIRRDTGRIRRETKCLISDEQVRNLVRHMTTGAMGFVNLPKWYIDMHLFGNYQRVFSRWPHVPMHGFAQFDTRLEGKSPYSTLVIEGMLFDDATTLWQNALRIVGDGLDFRTRQKDSQRELQCFLRATLTATYRFVEAYLNGIAFGCLLSFHETMKPTDHALLAEWDSKNKRTRFVSFERKLKEYPVICGKYLGRKIDLQKDDNVECLINEGKELRDGLTHPSPFFGPNTLTLDKVLANIAIKPDQVKRILGAAGRYVVKVERDFGRDPKKSAPWLQLEFPNE